MVNLDETSTEPGYLCHLPIDILLHILQFLEPKWILALRQCCWFLHEVTRNRGLWVNLFWQAMEAHQILPTSYPSDSMSQIDLESTTLRPYRFVSVLLQSSANGLSPSRKQTLSPPLPHDDLILGEDPDLDRYTDVLLPFGGRFLLTVYGGRLLTLWDLGTGTDVKTHPDLVASISAGELSLNDEERILTKECTATPDGKSFCLEVIIGGSDFMETSYAKGTTMCKVDPFGASHEVFVPFARLDHRGRYDTVLRDTQLVILGEATISVWNFEVDCSLSWDISRSSDNVTMFCLGPWCTLLECSIGRYTMWRIPELPDDPNTHASIMNTPLRRGHIFNHLSISSGVFPDVSEPRGYHRLAPTLLEVAPERNLRREGFEQLDTYTISIQEGADGKPSLDFQPYSGFKAHRTSRVYFTYYAHEEARIISVIRITEPREDEPGISLHVRVGNYSSDSGRNGDEAGETCLVNLVDTSDFSASIIDFCPFSARLAVAAGGSGEVHIYEYMS